MKLRLRPVLFALSLLGCPLALFATHNRAGEIHVEQIGPLTLRVTIITWTKASSTNADRDTLTPVSYTHLDVYKRQVLGKPDILILIFR